MSYEVNYTRYKELCDKYKILRSTYDKSSEELEEADVIVERVGSGYAHTRYRVVKNKPGLSYKDLAIICDSGNLCFGYRTEGSIICVYID